MRIFRSRTRSPITGTVKELNVFQDGDSIRINDIERNDDFNININITIVITKKNFLFIANKIKGEDNER